MAITIVSALPKTAPAPASEATGSVENTEAGNDFASLLLGQLFQSVPGTGSATAPLESSESESAGKEGTDPSDPLALLAAMSQAPAEQRSDVSAPPQQSAEELPLALKVDVQATAPTKPATTDSNDVAAPPSPSLTEEQTPANEQQAAKFAVPASSSRETVPSIASKPAEIQVTGTNEAQSSAPGIQAGAHAIRQESAPLAVPTPVRDRDWSNDFAQKVVWLATSHKQAAELTLTPPQMGNIEISLKIDNGTSSATATFVSTNAEVRETIEAALPRLREMLAGVGIELGQANVSAESFRQQASGQGGGSSDASRSTSDNAILASESPGSRMTGQIVTGQGRGLVDTFA